MKPIINIEFMAKPGQHRFKGEGIAFHSPAELFEFVSPGGGCERIPDKVDVIQMVFLPHTDPSPDNPMEDVPATLGMGRVFFTGPLSDIVQTNQLLLGKACRNELSHAFLKIIGMPVRGF